MNIKEKIKEILGKSNSRFFSAKQIYSMVGVSSSFDREVVKKSIDSLVGEGILSYDKKNKRYCLNVTNEVNTAVVDGNARGFGFLLMQDGHDLFVPASKMNGAYNRDTVAYKRVRNSSDEAEVTKIIERGLKEMVGLYQKQGGARFLIPDDKKFSSDIYIRPDKDMGAENGQKAVARIIKYPKDLRECPEGEIIRILGYPEESDVDMLSVAYSFGVKKEFASETSSKAAKVPQTVCQADIEGRTDFRKEITFTIDGEDAKDLDDAVSVLENGDGTYVLGVHIADVSHYVRPSDAIDKEAFERGTSVYFPDAVFPMLPVELSNGICSLYEKQDRLTLSCIMHIDGTGKILNSEIVESVINSSHRLTYDEVQKIMDGDEALRKRYSDITRTIDVMKNLAEILVAKREKRGNIDFESKEVKFVTQDGAVTDILIKERNFAHRLIEEFMIAANEATAEYAKNFELPYVYRIHETPDEEKMEILLALMAGVGISVNQAKHIDSSVLQAALKQAEKTKYFHLINDVMLRTMQKAKYSTVNVGHFGLSSECYCHFTSPIRRYADLTVHRVLKTAVTNKMTDRAMRAYADMCEQSARQCSIREKNADEAERKADDVKKCAYAERLIGLSFDAIISGVTENGIFAELENTVEGFIGVDKLSPELKFNERKFSLTNESTSYSLGDKIRISVESVNKSACKISFALDKAVD